MIHRHHAHPPSYQQVDEATIRERLMKRENGVCFLFHLLFFQHHHLFFCVSPMSWSERSESGKHVDLQRWVWEGGRWRKGGKFAILNRCQMFEMVEDWEEVEKTNVEKSETSSKSNVKTFPLRWSKLLLRQTWKHLTWQTKSSNGSSLQTLLHAPEEARTLKWHLSESQGRVDTARSILRNIFQLSKSSAVLGIGRGKMRRMKTTIFNL